MVSGNKNIPENTTHSLTKNPKSPVITVLERYLEKYFHELLAKDGHDMNEWKNFKENSIYEARFVESVTERLLTESQIIGSIDEFQVLEAFIKVLAMQIYEEEGSNIRFELKRNRNGLVSSIKKSDEPPKHTENAQPPQLIEAVPLPPLPPPLPAISSAGKFSSLAPPPPPPLSGISNADTFSTSVPPPPPPLPTSSSITVPPPPPPLRPTLGTGPPSSVGGIFGSTQPRKPKPSVQAIKKLKIPTLSSVSSNSIWAVADTNTLKEAEDLIPINEFENLFCASSEAVEAQQRNLDRAKSLIVTGPTVVCLLDTKRSTNISISLSQLKTFPEIQALFQRINKADTTISEDLLNALIKCEPSAEEIEMVKSYDGEFEELNLPEKFVLEFSKTPNMAWMIRVLRYMLKVPAWSEELKDGITALRDNFWTLRHSQLVLKLMMCLRRLYELNNVVYGQQRAVQGISFEGILEFTKIHSIKESSNKESVSMLEFFEGRMPGISDQLRESLKDMDKAVGTDWDVLAGDLADLKVADRFFFQNTENSESSFIEQVNPFFADWHEKIQKLDANFTDCRSSWLDLCEYFQEDSDSLKPHEFLKIWAELIIQLDLAKQKRLKFENQT